MKNGEKQTNEKPGKKRNSERGDDIGNRRKKH
jgi:hypothetical protein